MYFETLLQIYKHLELLCSLEKVTFYHYQSTLSIVSKILKSIFIIKIATTAFLQLVLTWFIFFYIFVFDIFVSLYLQWDFL